MNILVGNFILIIKKEAPNKRKRQRAMVRYVLCAGAPETKDSNFTWQDFKAKNNNELVAILGNFVHRTLVLTHKYFAGKVPMPSELAPIDKKVLDKLKVLPTQIEEAIEGYKFRQALGLWMQIARIGNKYLADTTPWKCFANDPKRVGTILHVCLQLIANITLLGEPFLPFTSKKLTNMLSLPSYLWKDIGSQLLPAGHVLQKPVMLFTKMEDHSLYNKPK